MEPHELEEKIRAGRHRARTDLFWLATEILDYRLIEHEVHDPVIAHLASFSGCQGKDEVRVGEGGLEVCYTPLADDPALVLPDGPRSRKRMLLDPRSWYKTTINCIAHNIQIILNFPQATTHIVHAQEGVAQKKLYDIKQHFFNNPKMKFFFPEFCYDNWNRMGNMSEFDIPFAKRRTGAPTISVSSITSAGAGMHYHWMKFTDCVEYQNSQTENQLTKVRETFAQYYNLLISPRHFIDVEGTCYNFDDYYNRTMDRELELPEEKRSWSIFVRGCFEKNPPAGEVESFRPEEREWPYLLDSKGNRISRFPNQDPLEHLEQLEGEDELQFACQKLNNPVASKEGDRPFPLNQISWIPAAGLPYVNVQHYEMVIDLAEKVEKRNDYTAICIFGVDRSGRSYLVDGKVGRFLPSDTENLIFEMYQRWKCLRCKIEESSFTRGLAVGMKRRMDLTGEYVNFDWIKRDTQESKKQRILGFQPFFQAGTIRFSENLDKHFKEQLKQQLTRFPATANDDILDCIADHFQNRKWFGSLGPRRTEREIQERALQQALERGYMEQSLFGEEEIYTGSSLGAL